MAGVAVLCAVRWYCSKQHLKLQQDNLSYGNVMKRSRHSIHLSSNPAGESVGQVSLGGGHLWGLVRVGVSSERWGMVSGSMEPVIKKECDCKFSNVRWGWGSVIFNLNNWLDLRVEFI